MSTVTRKSKRKVTTEATAAMASACGTNDETEEEMPELADVGTSDDDSSDDEDTEEEDNLHGPCDQKVFGADPPAPSLRTYIGQYVAKEFEVNNQEDLSLFWGEVVAYEPATKKFTVRIFCHLFMYFTHISTHAHVGGIQ